MILLLYSLGSFIHSFHFSSCRLLHPLSPRGKLVYQGRSGLLATNELVEQASNYQTCVVSESLFRVALHEKHVQQLKQTARTLPEYCEWISPQDMMMMQTSTTGGSPSPNVQGGLKLSNGCKVLHVPSYLQGLYMACQAKASGNITWTLLLENTCSSISHISSYSRITLMSWYWQRVPACFKTTRCYPCKIFQST